MRPWLAAWMIAGASLCLCATAGAAPFSVLLGSDRVILDTPAGFSETAAYGSPRLTEIAENLAEASSRVLAFAISDADARRFSVGDALELRNYLLAVTPRAKERERMTAAQYAALIQEAGRNLGTPPPALTDFRKYLEGRAPGQPHLLADLRRDSQVISLLYGTLVPQPVPWWAADKPPLVKISSLTLVNLGGRAIYLYAFSGYEGPGDVARIRAISETWTEQLQRLNK
jgi:hypothetical protein